MNIEEAKKISKIVGEIEKCENYLQSFNHTYDDEYELYYRCGKICELEPEVIVILREHYDGKLYSLKNMLSKIKG